MKAPRPAAGRRPEFPPGASGRGAGRRLWFQLPLSLLVLAPAAAQFETVPDPFVVAGGGAISTGGPFSISGTAGQPDAGRMSGGSYSIQSGFWQAFAAASYGSGYYTRWAGRMGLDATNRGLTQDPDADGMSNLNEFYLGGNPLAGDVASVPTFTIEAGYLILKFKRLDEAELEVAAQAVQFGASLNGWISSSIGPASSPADGNGVIVMVSENEANPDDVMVKIPLSKAVDGKLFGRLQIVE